MTISTTTTRQDFTGDGSTTAYDFSFKVMDEAWVKVDLDGVEQAAGWSIALNADQDVSPGGTVTFLVAPAASSTVRVWRSTPRTQETALAAYGAFPAKGVERALDRIVSAVQDVEAQGTGYVDAREEVLQASIDALAGDLANINSNSASRSYVDAAIAAAIVSPAVPDSTTLKQSAARLQQPPLQIPGALQARAIALRAVLSNRRINADGTEAWWPGGYTGWYLRDTYYAMLPFPGLFTASKIRTILDFWATGYIPAQRAVPFGWSDEGGWGYFLGAGFQVYDMPAIFGLVAALGIERGDGTAWATHGPMILDVMSAKPRGPNGLLYTPAAGTGYPALGFGFHDQLAITGELTAVSAQYALAYQRLAVLADPALQTQVDDLVVGLRTMRRSDGYYNASTDEHLPDLIATSLIAGNGLCSSAEAAETGNRMADDYRAGLISQLGGLRYLVAPNYWVQLRSPPSAQGHFQNGGYVPAFTWWAAKAMLAAGRTAEATALMTDLVREIIRPFNSVNTVARRSPYEYWNSEINDTGYYPYSATAGALEGVVEPLPQDLTLVVPGAAASSSSALVQAHSVTSIDVATPTAATAVVELLAAPVTYRDQFDQARNGFGSEVVVGKVGLAAATAGLQKIAVKPAAPYGGYLRARLLSGSAAQPVTVRLGQGERRTPRFLSSPSAPWSDTFGADSIASYIRNEMKAWSVTAGVLKNLAIWNYDPCLAPVDFADGDIQADVMSIYSGHNPGLVLRWKDPQNFIFAKVVPGNYIQVIELVNGVFSSLGTVAVVPTANVPIFLKMSLRGTALAVTVTSTTANFTVTNTGVGLAGAMTWSSLPGSTNTSTWDNLVVTPVPTSQRDWITDSETIYTRTGVWSKASNRMLSTDAAAFLAALHPDFSTPDLGVTALFKSANWAAKPAGLLVRGVSANDCTYVTLNGTKVQAYNRVGGVSTLLGEADLAAPLTNGVDTTLTVRVKGLVLYARHGSQNWAWRYTRPSANSTAGMVATGAGSYEVSYASMRIESYAANRLMPVPVGYVLDGGPMDSAWATDEVYAGNLAAEVALRDDTGRAVATAANGDDISLWY